MNSRIRRRDTYPATWPTHTHIADNKIPTLILKGPSIKKLQQITQTFERSKNGKSYTHKEVLAVRFRDQFVILDQVWVASEPKTHIFDPQKKVTCFFTLNKSVHDQRVCSALFIVSDQGALSLDLGLCGVG
jgi:hypothetical protein